MPGDNELRAMSQALELLRPLDVDARRRVLRWLADRLDRPDPAPVRAPLPALKEFLVEKAPPTRIATATCVAYWWEQQHGTPIATRDLGRLNDECGMPSWSDPGSTAQGAMTTRRWLERAEGQGLWRTTPEGRRMVEALPDQTLITDRRAYA